MNQEGPGDRRLAPSPYHRHLQPSHDVRPQQHLQDLRQPSES